MNSRIGNLRESFKAAAIGAAMNAGFATGLMVVPNVPADLKGSGVAIGSIMAATCLVIMGINAYRLNKANASIFEKHAP